MNYKDHSLLYLYLYKMFECILCGDTGSGNDEQYLVSKSMKSLISANRNIESVIIVGDNIYPSGCTDVNDEQFITKFQDPYKEIDLPFYLCLGNHDYGEGQTNMSQSQIDYTTSRVNTNNKWNMPARWYSHEWPECEFFFIDTNFEWSDEPTIRDQLNDTIMAIRNSQKRWKVLCGHHTWRSVGGHGNAEPKHEKFMDDLLRQVKIDLYVCGHDHCKSVIRVTKYNVTTLVIGTGGKPYDENMIYLDKLYADKSILEFFSPNLGVCHMKCNKNSLVLICYNEFLEEEYRYKIKK